MKLEKYNIISAVLTSFAQNLWHMTNDGPVTKGRLLPVVNTDLLISVSTPIVYSGAGEEQSPAPPVHIRNIKLRPQFVWQAPGSDVWGVSLLPYGVYAFAGDMNGCGEGVIDLSGGHPEICKALIDGLSSLTSSTECVAFIEKQIEKLIKAVIPEGDRAIMDEFIAGMPCCGIGEHCKAAGVGVKRLERLFKKYTGMTPKQLQRIERFQRAGNEVIYGAAPQSLSDIAYSHRFADQTHFIKNFKEYAGETPILFMERSDSIKKRIDRQQ